MYSRLTIALVSVTLIAFFAIISGLVGAFGEQPFVAVWFAGSIAVFLFWMVAIGGMGLRLIAAATVMSGVEKRLPKYMVWILAIAAFLATYSFAVVIRNAFASLNENVEDRYFRYSGSFSQ